MVSRPAAISMVPMISAAASPTPGKISAIGPKRALASSARRLAAAARAAELADVGDLGVRAVEDMD